MIEYVTIGGWLPLPTHVEVTLYYMHGSTKCIAHRTLPPGTAKTPHNEHTTIQRFKMEAQQEGFRHVVRKQRVVADNSPAAKVGARAGKESTGKYNTKARRRTVEG